MTQELEQLVSVDSILNFLEDAVSHKKVLGAHQWLTAAQKLNVLLGNEHDKLFTLQQEVTRATVLELTSQDKRNVALAKTMVQATDIYKDMRLQEAKIKRVEEFIRIAKLQARMKNEEYQGGNFTP